MSNWSPQQEKALVEVGEWMKENMNLKKLGKSPRQQVFKLMGFAGTGKTTLAKELAANYTKVYFAAFTGKAASVLSKKGCPARTIHSLIYRLVEGQLGGTPIFELNPDSPLVWANLIIIDEVSMVNEEMGMDLESFGVPILVLGDPAQLPPVKGSGYFIGGEPDIMLTEIHRQAADNPIIQMATDIRHGKMPKYGTYGESQVLRKLGDEERAMSVDQMIVGKNLTRHQFNARARELKGFEGDLPMVGEKIICLMNNRKFGLLNGTQWYVTKLVDTEAEFPKIRIRSEDWEGDRDIQVDIHRQYFIGEEPNTRDRAIAEHFDFGYAITAHKSQGSQWEHIMVFDESYVFRADRWKWLYTAVTRAEKKLDLITRG